MFNWFLRLSQNDWLASEGSIVLPWWHCCAEAVKNQTSRETQTRMFIIMQWLLLFHNTLTFQAWPFYIWIWRDFFRGISEIAMMGPPVPSWRFRAQPLWCASAVDRLRHWVDRCFASIVWRISGEPSGRHNRAILWLKVLCRVDLAFGAWKRVIEYCKDSFWWDNRSPRAAGWAAEIWVRPDSLDEPSDLNLLSSFFAAYWFSGTGTNGPIFQNKVRAWSMVRDREKIQQKYKQEYNTSKQSLRFL